jgi:hypothetical protein
MTGYADREVTHPPNWHGLVVADVLLNHLATGLFLIMAMAELANPAAFRAAAAWAYPLALLILSADLVCLVLDLGDPLRFHHMLRVFKPLSPMSLGTWCLTAFSLPLGLLGVLEVAVKVGLLPADPAWVGWLRTPLLVLGLPAAFGSAAYKGVLFSVTAQPGWRDARWLGAYFVATGLALGCGLAAVLGAPLRLAFALLVLLHAVLLGLVGGELLPALRRTMSRSRLLTAGGLAASFGVVIPLVLLVAGDGLAFLASAFVSLLLGAWLVRHVIVFLPHEFAGH